VGSWHCVGAIILIVAWPVAGGAAQQAAAGPNDPAAQFEAATVKLIDRNMRGSHSRSQSDPSRISLIGTLHVLLMRAYGVTKDQIGAEPDWAKTQLYSIEAVTTTPVEEEQMKPMLRNLLGERFELKLREEERDMPVFLLKVAPGGPAFSKLAGGAEPQEKKVPAGVIARSFKSVPELVRALNGSSGGNFTLDRLVIDETNLVGPYNIQIVTEVEPQIEPDGQRNPKFPNLVHDLQSPLGLKLVPARSKMPYFVVEHCAEPGPN
jgi:uncharacterized protein (TIGR03435 family)